MPHQLPIQVNERKSSGPDNIPPRLIKAAAHTLVTPIRILLNTSLSEGVLSDEWKKANIKPIPKSKSACELKDFRPIALTSTISKCLERLLDKRFQPLITDPHQFAYHRGRSTEDALLLTMNRVNI